MRQNYPAPVSELISRDDPFSSSDSWISSREVVWLVRRLPERRISRVDKQYALIPFTNWYITPSGLRHLLIWQFYDKQSAVKVCSGLFRCPPCWTSSGNWVKSKRLAKLYCRLIFGSWWLSLLFLQIGTAFARYLTLRINI